jgi:hypothetical protein
MHNKIYKLKKWLIYFQNKGRKDYGNFLRIIGPLAEAIWGSSDHFLYSVLQ